MPQDINLSPASLKLLAANGMPLGGMAAAGRLADQSVIEGPTSIQCTVAPGAYLDIGAYCNLSGGQINNLRAGRYCSISDGVSIGTHEHPTDWLTTSRTAYYPEVNGWDSLMLGEEARGLASRIKVYSGSCPVTTLGADVWIGQGAFLKSGIRVGTGAIIGARATVLKDVPPYAIMVGTPARVVRLRFADALVERFLASRWWTYSIYDLFAAPMDDAARALDVIEEKIASGQVQPFAGPVFTVADFARPEAVVARLRAVARQARSPEAGQDRGAA